jgi:hypothetical protein
MKNLTFVCAILFVLLTLADTDLGQSRSLLIDSTRPSVFISFDKAGLLPPLFEGESGDRYWLKLHNNTAVKLFVCKFDVPKRYGDYGIETEVVEEFGRSAGIAHPRGYLPTGRMRYPKHRPW